MAKISYSDHVKKNDISVILSEIIFQYLKKQYKTTELSKVVETSSGGTPSRTNPQYYGGQIPWLKSGELNDSIITYAEEFITEEGLNNSSAKVFPKGTLLIAMYGATAGKTGILNMDAASNQAVCSITPKDSSINTDFLFWFFRAHRFYFIDISRGGAQPNISQGVINKTLFPIVPKDIQKKVTVFLSNAEKTKFIDYSLIPSELHDDIKSAFNYLFCLESLVFENKGQKTYLIQLRQAILQEAIEGKLTADWRVKNPVEKGNPDFDATALLETINAEKQKLIAEGKIKKEKPLAPINPDDVPFALPDGWVWCKFGDYSTLERGRFSIRPRNDKSCYGGKFPFIQIGALNGNGDVVTNYKQTLNEKGYVASKEFPKGTIAVAVVGGTIGNLGVLGMDMCFPDSMVGIRPFHGINQTYKLLLLKYKQPEIKKAAYQMAGQPNIKIPTLAELVIPLPPLGEQNAIVERVDRLLASVNALEQQVQERKTYAEQLMQAVLKEAFAG